MSFAVTGMRIKNCNPFRGLCFVCWTNPGLVSGATDLFSLPGKFDFSAV
jgi:hypothetical protein